MGSEGTNGVLMEPSMGRQIIMRKHRCSKNQKNLESTALTRWLTISKVFVFLLCTTLPFIEGRSTSDSSEDSNSTVGSQGDWCLSPECLDIAYRVLKNMDVTVDPCENFYQYACGGFINETILAENRTKVNILITGADKVREQLQTLIEAEIEPNDRRPTVLLKNFYDVCINANTTYEFLILNDKLFSFGGWPVLGGTWKPAEFVWTDMIYKFRDAGFDYDNLMTVTVNVDLYNNTRRAIVIDHATLGIHRNYLLNGSDDKHVQDYYKLMVDTAVTLGAGKKRARKELKEVLNFELQLAQITLRDERRQKIDRYYISMTLATLSHMVPNVPWKEYLTRLLPSSVTIDEDQIILVGDPDYFLRLEKLLAATPKKVLANFLIWGPVRFARTYMERVWTSEECFTAAFDNFPSVIGAMYVKHYFSREDRETAIEMVTDIRRQFEIMLENTEWMDNKTRMMALEKAAAMVNHIGYPDDLLDDDKLDKIYENLKLPGEVHLLNSLTVRHFNDDLSMKKLHKLKDGTDWNAPGNAATVDAFHSWYDNSLEFPAGVLRNVFLNKGKPNYMKYGDFGYAVGHEITHGYDAIGKLFDKDGNINNWWEPATVELFRQREQCIIEQYGKYTIPELDLHVDGNNTLHENMADNGGIKIAYLAYKSWVARNKPEKMLPGFGRNPMQMFWLSTANAWCAKYTDEGLRTEITFESHTPEEFRIIGSFSNMPEFANDYKCPEGSRMNPKEKCSIW